MGLKRDRDAGGGGWSEGVVVEGIKRKKGGVVIRYLMLASQVENRSLVRMG